MSKKNKKPTGKPANEPKPDCGCAVCTVINPLLQQLRARCPDLEAPMKVMVEHMESESVRLEFAVQLLHGNIPGFEWIRDGIIQKCGQGGVKLLNEIANRVTADPAYIQKYKLKSSTTPDTESGYSKN